MSWQPIKTVPKDGTLVDVWVGGERVTDCKWCLPDKRYTSDKQRPEALCHCTDIDYEGVRGWEELYQTWTLDSITHWMYPPKGPKE